MDERASELARRIKAVRKALNVTQNDFAKSLGVSRSYLSEVETEKGKPSVEMVLGIAEKHEKVSLEWLLTGKGDVLINGDETWSTSGRTSIIFELACELAEDLPWPQPHSVPPRAFAKIVVLLMSVMEGAYRIALSRPNTAVEGAVREALKAGRGLLADQLVRDLAITSKIR